MNKIHFIPYTQDNYARLLADFSNAVPRGHKTFQSLGHSYSIPEAMRVLKAWQRRLRGE